MAPLLGPCSLEVKLSLAKLRKIQHSIEALKEYYDAHDILAPLPYLEEMLDSMESAIEEMSEYDKAGHDEDE